MAYPANEAWQLNLSGLSSEAWQLNLSGLSSTLSGQQQNTGINSYLSYTQHVFDDPAPSGQVSSGVNDFLKQMPFAPHEGELVVVVVPLADMARLSDVDIWRRLENDLAIAADEVLVQRGLGCYRVIKHRDERIPLFGVAGDEILSSEALRKRLVELRSRLAGHAAA